jgi:DNA topoisomerase II
LISKKKKEKMDVDSYSYMSAEESDFYSEDENKPVPATKKTIGKSKGSVAPKVTKSKAAIGSVKSRNILATNLSIGNVEPSNNDLMEFTKPKSNKTIEEIYQKKTQLEHILLRPDTYST